ncbi:MAG TPA: hypothetical protein VIL95_02765 [Bacillota bacterium]
MLTDLESGRTAPIPFAPGFNDGHRQWLGFSADGSGAWIGLAHRDEMQRGVELDFPAALAAVYRVGRDGRLLASTPTAGSAW